MTTGTVLTAAKMRGLNLHELDEITWGQLIDIIIVYNNMHLSEDQKEETPKTRIATQADWDNF